MESNTHTAEASENTAEPETSDSFPISITDAEGMMIKECVAKTGRSAPQFILKAVLEYCAHLEDDALTAIPCPFCNRTDSLEILPWCNERKDGTEYEGDAVRCNRCDAIASVESWARRGLYLSSPAQGQPQGGRA